MTEAGIIVETSEIPVSLHGATTQKIVNFKN
jgi:hypothetical protein